MEPSLRENGPSEGQTTRRIVGRAAEVQTIRRFFESCKENGRGGSLYVSGRSGTGKTEVCRMVFEEFMRQTLGDDLHTSKGPVVKRTKEVSFKAEWIKGSGNDTGSQYLLQIAERFGLRANVKTVEGMFEETMTQKCGGLVYVLVIDEIDLLPHELVKRLFKWASRSSRFALLGIANVVSVETRLVRFDHNKPQELIFEPYKQDDLLEIVKLKLDFRVSRFDPAALEMCARRIASKSGDVRDCLSLCERVLGSVPFEQSIKIGDVLRASNVATPMAKQIMNLTPQARFALVACVVAYRKASKSDKAVDENAALAEEPQAFDLWLEESMLKQAWAELRDVWKVPIEEKISDLLDYLQSSGILETKTAKTSKGIAKRMTSFRIKPLRGEIESALIGSDEDAAEIKRRPIVMAFKGIRPRTFANMHVPLESS